MERIIVVEDNLTFSGYVCRLLESKGFQTVSTSTCNGARKLFAKMREDDIVLADMRLPDGDGLLEMSLPPLLKNLRERMARHETPIYERQSVAFREIDHKIRLVAPTNMGVLVLGENGTGKEHIAEKIHTMSKRAGKPFVAVDCGLLSKELAASALFGHEKGAFTGADTAKNGYFDMAKGGTLFLDEIGTMPIDIQSMLLRVLQENTYTPIGSDRERMADVRIVAATNENLERAIKEGRFREDLYHRLAEMEIRMPSLAECADDILPLAEFFRERFSKELKKETKGFSKDAIYRLRSYRWPGNVRELQNRIKRAVLLTETPVLELPDLNADSQTDIRITEKTPDILPLKDENSEREAIANALQACNGHREQTARLLNVNSSTLYRKMKKYGIR